MKGNCEEIMTRYTDTIFVCKDSKNKYFGKVLDYQFLLFSFLAFFLSVGLTIKKCIIKYV